MDNQGLIKPKSKEYVWFNENTTRKMILNKVLEGKSSSVIAKDLDIKELLVINTMNHPHFINRLNKKLHAIQTNLTVSKVKTHLNLIEILVGSLTKKLPKEKRVQMTDAQIVNQLSTLTKADAHKIKIERNPSFVFNWNTGKDREKSKEREEEEEANLYKKFGIDAPISEAETENE